MSCRVLIPLLAAALLPATAVAQRDTVVAAGPHYSAAALHRFFFGTDYRDLWTTPIRVPLLNLRTYAGGLRPTETGGGMQTRSLRFRGADGHEYRFRSVNKNTQLLPDILKGTFLDDIVRDQTRALHPGASLVAGPLSAAAGIPHAPVTLFVMPDTPALGEFREEFAGMLGTLERHPEPRDRAGGMRGVLEIENSDKVLSRALRDPADRIDLRALASARLLDLLLGDWDRHRGNWDWARTTDGAVRWWRPIPKDRDHALVRFDGLALWAVRQTRDAQLTNFGRNYTSLEGMAFNGRDIDRWFLGRLEGTVWDSVAIALRGQLTDSVLAAAVAVLPEEWQAVDGARLLAALRQRRDGLPAEARRFYHWLAREAEIHLTARAEDVVLERAAGQLTMTAGLRGAEPYLRRTLRPDETRELRLYLEGGDDRVVLRGTGPAHIRVRIIATRAAEIVDSSGSGGFERYQANWRPEPASIRPEEPDTLVGDSAAQHMPGDDEEDEDDRLPPPPDRDYGSRLSPTVWWDGGPDIGVFLGAGVIRTTFGFRRLPWSSLWTFRAGWATQAATGRLSVNGVLRRTESRVRTEFDGYLSGIEVLRWHGRGNETGNTESSPYYRVNRAETGAETRLVIPVARNLEVAVGPAVTWADTRHQTGRIIADSTPYGSGSFGMAGARAELSFDTRDFVTAPTRGAAFSLGGSAWPAIWNVESAFSELHTAASAYVTPGPLRATLAARAGARKVFGRYPYAEAAFIGDPGTVRLGRQNRYGGDAAAWAGTELRLPVTHFSVLLPGELGVFGLAETGRVWLRGESSSRWHPAVGGGIWLSFVQPKNLISIAAVSTDDGMAWYVRAGFHY